MAKDGGNGEGNGGGNSGKSGEGKGSGNESKGKDGKDGNAGNSGNAKEGTVNQSKPETRKSVKIDGSAIEVRHANGMSESIIHGRYVMKDAKGRTIINRTATPLDQLRLQMFAR